MDNKEFLELFEKAAKEPPPWEQKDVLILNQKLLVIGISLFFIIATTFVLTLGNKKEKKPVKRPFLSSNQSIIVSSSPVTTKQDSPLTTVEGKVSCIPNDTRYTQNLSCSVGVRTADGKYYRLPNISQTDITSGKLAIGNQVILQGVISPSSSGGSSGGSSGSSTGGSSSTGGGSSQSQSSGDLILSTPTSPAGGSSGSGGGISQQNTPTPTNPNQSGSSSTPTIPPGTIPTPTSSITVAPSNTPTPTLIFPTPTPTSPISGNITYIMQHGQALNGLIMGVSGYLVGGAIGQDGCASLGICDKSIFILNDNPNLNRDTNYDLTVNANITEKEENYYIGQGLTILGRINYYSDGTVTVDKIY